MDVKNGGGTVKLYCAYCRKLLLKSEFGTLNRNPYSLKNVCRICLKRKNRCIRMWDYNMAKCYNPNHPQYKSFGLRGVTVCAEWHSQENFVRYCMDFDDIWAGPNKSLKLKFGAMEYSPKNTMWVNSPKPNVKKLTQFQIGSVKSLINLGVRNCEIIRAFEVAQQKISDPTIRKIRNGELHSKVEPLPMGDVRHVYYVPLKYYDEIDDIKKEPSLMRDKAASDELNRLMKANKTGDKT